MKMSLIEQAQTEDRRQTVFDLLGRCAEYIEIEEHCSIATNTIPGLRADIVNIENAMIDTATGDLSTGVLYVSTFLVQNKYLYTRWMDGGDLQGFVRSHRSIFRNTGPSTEKQVTWQVMTADDMERRSESYSSHLEAKRQKQNISKVLPSSGRRWTQIVGGDHTQNKKSVHSSLAHLNQRTASQDILVLGTIVHIGKKVHNISLENRSEAQYHCQTGIYAGIDLMSKINQHILHRSLDPIHSFMDFVANYRREALDLFAQEEVINLLANDAAPNGKVKPLYNSYFSTGSAMLADERIVLKYIPASQRNKILYHWRLRNNGPIGQMLLSSASPCRSGRPNGPRHENTRPQTALSKPSSPLSRPNGHEETIPEYEEPIIGYEAPNRNPTTTFNRFVQALVGPSGVLKWRIQTDSLDTLAMNDVNLDSERFMKNAFIHVSRVVLISGEVLFSCSCKMAATIKQLQYDKGEKKPSPNCCHIRFFREYVEPHLATLSSGNLAAPNTPIGRKIILSIDERNNCVAKLGSDKFHHRFSVICPNFRSCQLVNLESDTFSCQSGKCRATKGHIWKIEKISEPKSCPHIRALNTNVESWQHLVKYAGPDRPESTTEEIERQEEMGDSEDKVMGEETSTRCVNPVTGLWNYPSYSTHCPRQQEEPVFRKAAEYCNSLNPHNSDRIQTVFDLLGHCAEYIEIEEHCSIATNTIPGLRADIVNIENAMIDTATGDLSTGVLYMSTFLVQNKYLYTRWMDGGDLQGFVRSRRSIFRNTGPSTEKQLTWQVMTADDLERRSESYSSHLEAKRQKQNISKLPSSGRRWTQIVGGDHTQNKKSVHSSLGRLIQRTASSDIKVLGTIVHIGKKEHNISLENRSESQYHCQTGIYAGIDLMSKINHHILHRSLDPIHSFMDFVANYRREALDLSTQEEVINLLANDAALKGKVKPLYNSYFSTGSATLADERIVLKYIPASQRNKILYHWRLGNNGPIGQYAVIQCLSMSVW